MCSELNIMTRWREDWLERDSAQGSQQQNLWYDRERRKGYRRGEVKRLAASALFSEKTSVADWNKVYLHLWELGRNGFPSSGQAYSVDAAQESLRCGGCGIHSSHCVGTREMEKDVGGCISFQSHIWSLMSLCDLEGIGRH